MHAEVLPWAICVPSFWLIAQVVFLVKHGQTQDATNEMSLLMSEPGHG